LVDKKSHYIKLFRDNGFNCFPLTKYGNDEPEQKRADHRYDSERTRQNQEIKPEENYGVLPIQGKGNCIVDFDNKERYRKRVEQFIKEGYMIIESPHGWHLPVIGLTGIITKMELFDYNIQEKKIIEIQSPKFFVVGCESDIFDFDINQRVKYLNRGTDKIFDAKGKDFNDFVDKICSQYNVKGKKKSSSSHRNYRERFKQGIPPTKGTSNDYFFDASIQCLTDGLSIDEARQKIQEVYDKWENPTREWSNIEAKITDAYENGEPLHTGRPNETFKSGLDRQGVADGILLSRKLFSNSETRDVFENKSGFLEKINHTLKKELYAQFKELTKADYEDILFKLESGAKDIPKTNSDLIVFKDGKRNVFTKEIDESEDLADMGFKDYSYLSPTKENEPTKFLEILFSNVPKNEHPRIKAGLKAVLLNRLDPKISIIVGKSGVGKSTGIGILAMVLGEYALTVELNQLLKDGFIKAKIIGKRLLNLDDIPKVWTKWETIKTLTGNVEKTERGFHQDATVGFTNKIKIWASGNYLPEVPEEEQDAMFTRRFSLIHNTRQEEYPEDSGFAEKIAEEEGEKIISWILNIPEEDCKYEAKEVLQNEWQGIATPEVMYLESKFDEDDDQESKPIHVRTIWKKYQKDTGKKISMKLFAERVSNQGYSVRYNFVYNIKEKDSEIQQGGLTP
jgi:hypothetical protein